jgi:hypothetical protein
VPIRGERWWPPVHAAVLASHLRLRGGLEGGLHAARTALLVKLEELGRQRECKAKAVKKGEREESGGRRDARRRFLLTKLENRDLGCRASHAGGSSSPGHSAAAVQDLTPGPKPECVLRIYF